MMCVSGSRVPELMMFSCILLSRACKTESLNACKDVIATLQDLLVDGKLSVKLYPQAPANATMVGLQGGQGKLGPWVLTEEGLN